MKLGRCYHRAVYSPLYVALLVVVAVYVLAGVWRYLRQALQPPRRGGGQKRGG